jgi:hypothetical protein
MENPSNKVIPDNISISVSVIALAVNVGNLQIIDSLLKYLKNIDIDLGLIT